jgi:hypothetical protein
MDALAEFNAAKTEEKPSFPVPVRLPTEGTTVIAVLKRVNLPKAETKEPYKLICYVMKSATVQHERKKKKKDDASIEIIQASEGPLPDPIELRAGQSAIFVAFWPPKCTLPHGNPVTPLTLIPGVAYALRGFTYRKYEDTYSYMCADVDEALETKFEIPFVDRCIVHERDCCIGLNEYDATAKGAYIQIEIDNGVLTGTPPFTVGRITYKRADLERSDYLERPIRGDKTKLEIGLGGANDKPNVEVLQVNADGVVEKYGARFGGYASDFTSLHLSFEQWKALARVMVPHFTGQLLSTVNRKNTAGMKTPEGYKGMIDLDGTLVLNVPAVVERCGLNVDAETLVQFLPNPGAMFADDWKDSPMSYNHSANAINLTQVTGDVTELLKAVTEGTHKAFIVSREMASEERIAALRALPMDERAAAVVDDVAMAFYVTGNGVRGMLKPPQKMARRKA